LFSISFLLFRQNNHIDDVDQQEEEDDKEEINLDDKSGFEKHQIQVNLTSFDSFIQISLALLFLAQTSYRYN
jgi:hypothetical protein